MSPTLETPPVEERGASRPALELLPAPPPRGPGYRPFGNAETRNGLQARVEIPLMVRALKLPRGGRLLEIGCGHGVALPVSTSAPAITWAIH